MKIAHWGLGILLVMPMGIAAGQAQPASQDAQAPAPAPTDTLAAAAKQAREAKKDQPKPARVWNDDTIPKSNAAISVVGQTPDETAGTLLRRVTRLLLRPRLRPMVRQEPAGERAVELRWKAPSRMPRKNWRR